MCQDARADHRAMVRLIARSVVALMLTGAVSGRSLAQGTLLAGNETRWVGVASIGGRAHFINVSLASNDRAPLGSVEVPGECWSRLGILDRRVDGLAVTLLIEKLGRFRGTVRGATFAGVVTDGDAAGAFRLVPAARLHPTMLAKLYGDYRLPDSSLIAFSPAGDPATGLSMRIGDEVQTLVPVADTAFLASPTGAAVVFAHVAGDQWTVRIQDAGRVLTGRRVALYRTEDVTFASDGVTLGGTLMLPEGAVMRRPAVLFVHGSGPAGRNSLWMRAEDLARHGVVTLVTDKRGYGRSDGDWATISFQDRVNDALAAVAYLRQRSEVDPAEVGLWGISQGGWVVPMAAAQSRDVAFIIPVSAAGVSPADQELYRLGWQLRSEGHTEADIATILDGWRLDYHYMRNRQGAAALDSAVRNIRKRFGTAADDLPLASAEIGVNDVMINLSLDHDPAPLLRQIHVPVLAIWGQNDKFVPVERSVAVFRDNLAAGGDSDVTIKVFPGATHPLHVGENGASLACEKSAVLAPGYFATIRDWIARVTKPKIP